MINLLFLVLACFSGYNPTIVEEKFEKIGEGDVGEDTDADGDGFSVLAGDCNDEDPSIHPEAIEVCDGIDNNCNANVDEEVKQLWYIDNDSDGFGDYENPYFSCEPPEGYVGNDEDCNDAESTIHPEAAEVCNNLDDNCNDIADDGVGSPMYLDNDSDGYGNASELIYSCFPTDGYVGNDEDCDDDSSAVHPAASEVCNAIDDNCDNLVDNNAVDASIWFFDADGDGFAGAELSLQACLPPDGYLSSDVDCNDENPDINPSASERCDGVDNDCNNLIDDNAIDANTFYADDDNDGHGDPQNVISACSRPSGYVSSNDDCNDSNTGINPGATEVCDELDNNCNNLIDAADPALDPSSIETYYLDNDNDGYGNTFLSLQACTIPNGYSNNNDDCNDETPGINPSASERCDGVDNDCNNLIDDNAIDANTYYLDNDNDGYGDPQDTVSSCARPSGYMSNDDDCNDNNASVWPGATEVCDNADNNCDGIIDSDAVNQVNWYQDADGDGYGNTNVIESACTQPNGFTLDATDCDDTQATISPEAIEICNNVDENCNGLIDDNPSNGVTWYADADRDGYGDPFNSLEACTQPNGYTTNQQDCNDVNPSINPGAPEICDNIDNNCDPTDDITPDASFQWFADNDGDGFGDPFTSEFACEAPSGYISDNGDCNDANPGIHPNAAEQCNGLDENCNGVIDENAPSSNVWYADNDGDGFGSSTDSVNACTAPDGYISDDADCNDGNSSISPSAVEVCDGLDNNCDGRSDDDDPSTDTLSMSAWSVDNDGDGFGDISNAVLACTQPQGSIEDATDCNDRNADINPGEDEKCDGLDNDCDGNIDNDAIDAELWYADNDGDGFGGLESVRTCERPSGFQSDSSDCDDSDSDKNPSAIEICNGEDDDCNDQIDDNAVSAGTWFFDGDGDGFGDDGTALQTCSPPSGYIVDGGDCDDADLSISPGATEICDGIDNNCDGRIDDDDPSLDESGNTLYSPDDDGDGFGDSNSSVFLCNAPLGYVEDASDCDDTSALVNPNRPERCDGLDNDCDGEIDIGAQDGRVWYGDGDGDGYAGDGDTILACEQPSGYSPAKEDCDDENAAIYPGAIEVCNNTDDNCNNQIDEGANILGSWYKDADEDGFGDPQEVEESCEQPGGYVLLNTDCNDGNASINPGADEICDGLDNDCDALIDAADSDAVLSEWYRDLDGDDYGDPSDSTLSCATPNGYVEDNTDCNDADPLIFPTAPELCDSQDQDCDGEIDEIAIDGDIWYADNDGDGYGGTEIQACEPQADYSSTKDDCDDNDVSVYPGATEICNGNDDNCDGTIDEGASSNIYYRDGDGDGFGAPNTDVESCTPPNGYVENQEDCNDNDVAINPESTETCNNIDDNCDGTIDEGTSTDAQAWYIDYDRDGYGSSNIIEYACSQPSLYVSNNMDCNDLNADVYPGASEVCNEIDDDCNTLVDEDDPALDKSTAVSWYIDGDGDGYGDSSTLQYSCIAPTGSVEEGGDCNDNNEDSYPDALEILDAEDNDCDGTIDESAIAMIFGRQCLAQSGSGTYTPSQLTGFESDQIEAYLSDMSLGMDRFDEASGWGNVLNYNAVLYTKCGWSWQNANQPLLDDLLSARANGISTFLFGDDITWNGTAMSGVENVILISNAYENGSNSTVTINNYTHPIMFGSYGSITDFQYDFDMDRAYHWNNGETVLATQGVYNFPAWAVHDDGNSRAAVFMGSLYASNHGFLGAPASLEIVLKNTVQWLVYKENQ